MNAERLRDLSIRAKLLGAALMAGFVALALAGLAIVAYDSATYRQQKLAELNSQAEVLGAISSAALTFDDPKAAQEYLSTMRVRTGVVSAALYDAKGRVFASYQRAGASSNLPEAAQAEGVRLDGDELLLFRRIADGKETLGTVFLRAELGLRSRRLRFIEIELLVMLVALGVATLVSVRLHSLISLPLLELTQAARAVVDRQDYSQRAVKQSQDEVGVLVDAFNQMLGGLQQREEALSAANKALQSEIAEHKAAREEVAALNQSLERRVAERTAELEGLNKELESFSYSVSHDLRAPLRGIDGFAMLLQKSHGDRLDEQGRGYLDRVRAATQRMGHLIDDLLNLSRTSRSEIVLEDLDLSELAQSVGRELCVASPDRKVDLTVAPGLKVHADPTLMRVVLENLMGNAWKFTRDTPGARVEVGGKPSEGQPIYFIRDNGAGFDMQYAEKLFGAFQRLHSVTEFDGTGVGLANVQRVIHRHGGRVWAEAVVGRGATFYFTLPA